MFQAADELMKSYSLSCIYGSLSASKYSSLNDITSVPMRFRYRRFLPARGCPWTMYSSTGIMPVTVSRRVPIFPYERGPVVVNGGTSLFSQYSDDWIGERQLVMELWPWGVSGACREWNMQLVLMQWLRHPKQQMLNTSSRSKS